MVEPNSQLLSAYLPRELDIVCRRCARQASVETHRLRSRFGDDITLAEVARRIATEGERPCFLAQQGDGCSVQAIEPPFEMWATLSDARLGGWVGWLSCRRRHAALKAAKSCPGEFMVDVHTLLMTLPWDFRLERLPSGRLTCPECQTHSVSIWWEQMVPPPRLAPAARRASAMGKGGLRLVKKAV